MISFFFYNTDKESVTSAGGGIMKKYILAAVLLLGMAGAAGVSYGSGSTEDLMAPIAYTDWGNRKSQTDDRKSRRCKGYEHGGPGRCATRLPKPEESMQWKIA